VAVGDPPPPAAAPAVWVTARRSKASARRPGGRFAAGHTQAELARTLGVTRQTSAAGTPMASGRTEALSSAGPTGPTPRLSDAQLAAIDQAPGQGARTHRLDSNHWALARVTSVIEHQTGVAYHPGHVWQLLRHRLPYPLQRPARRAVERDQRAIARWVPEDWPSNPAQRSPSPGRDRVLRRVRQLTAAGRPSDLGAPRPHPGHRPHCTWKRISLAPALCHGSRGGGAQLTLHRHPDACDTDSLAGALGQLRCALGGQQAT
jgi:transposase